MPKTTSPNGFAIERSFDGPFIQELFNNDLQDLLIRLHKKFEPIRQELLIQRKERQKIYDQGERPTYLDRNSEAVTGNWKVASIPQDLTKRRVEITGPVNDPKMVINMLSRNADGYRADTAMLDFEDSMKPSWQNVINGYRNVIAVTQNNLQYTKEATEQSPEKIYKLDHHDMAVMMIRVRGLHLNENNLTIFNEPISAGLLDLATCFFTNAKKMLEQKRTPKFYIPKCEHYLEARFWNDLFCDLERELNLPNSTLRATFLIETLPAAFQIEEILYEIRDHATGLNVGRWDKIFSDIKVLKNHADLITPDRSYIDMSRYWMDNYAKRLIKICHKHGAYAIGGMSAFTPGKDSTTREVQTQKVRQDKENEAHIGHDGCWVSHPYFIGYAMEAFKQDHQLHCMLDNFQIYPNLIHDGKGPKTLEGLRKNIRVGIAYLHGWNNNLGCVAWDNMMEDLATLEISRAQTWQWLHHGVTLDGGEKVNEDLVKSLFEQELSKILAELKIDTNQQHSQKIQNEFIKAKDDALQIFCSKELQDFLSTGSEIFS